MCAGSVRGHVKFSAGAFSVHWVLLIPCPLRVFPSLLFFVCVCVLIIRWLLACFPNPTLTFLSATEKQAFHPLEGRQRGQGESQLCTNPGQCCPAASEEDEDLSAAGSCGQRPSGPHEPCPPGPLHRAGSPGPEGSSDLHKVTQVQSEQNDFGFQNCYHKAFSSLGNHSAQSAFPHTKNS